MPNAPKVDTIVVVGTRPDGGANPFMVMFWFMDAAMAVPRQIIIMEPASGTVQGHSITVKWGGIRPPTKPALAQAQIEALRDAFLRVGAVVAALTDSAVYTFGGQKITGAALKSAYFALTIIEVTEDIYSPGYGGQNLGTTLRIGMSTAAGWGVAGGDAGYNFIMLHEAVHNSVAGRAIVQQNWDRHRKALNAGTLTGPYDSSNPHFVMQEQMTNSITKEIGNQIGVATDPGRPGYPTYGYYSGGELNGP